MSALRVVPQFREPSEVDDEEPTYTPQEPDWGEPTAITEALTDAVIEQQVDEAESTDDEYVPQPVRRPWADSAEPLTFEGRTVDRTEFKLVGQVTLDGVTYEGLKVSVDDRVNLHLVARGTRVSHYVDAKGLLVRLQEVKAIQVELVPFNEADENDFGVIRG